MTKRRGVSSLIFDAQRLSHEEPLLLFLLLLLVLFLLLVVVVVGLPVLVLLFCWPGGSHCRVVVAAVAAVGSLPLSVLDVSVVDAFAAIDGRSPSLLVVCGVARSRVRLNARAFEAWGWWGPCLMWSQGADCVKGVTPTLHGRATRCDCGRVGVERR